ncbi:MAG: phosphate signaling complex protein PhoU [Rhodobacteraceae bacterium]|nr:phosphate signaling complex protein PhoU [Paracoccaceae bacterium]
MQQDHIHSAFDADLSSLRSQVMTMGGLVENSIRQVSKALNRRDSERADRVVAGDVEIDKLEELISRKAIELIALRQPNARDLRTAIAVMKIAVSLERVADYSKNIAKRSTVLTHSPPLDIGIGSIKRLSKAVRIQIKHVLDAFIKGDVERADFVIYRDEEIDQMYNALFREFLTHMMEDPRSISSCMHFLFIAKNLERMGDHATAIAEQVIYMITGTLPTDDRDKNVMTDFDEYLT